MNKTKTDITHIFSTPIWTAIIPNYKEINIKMSSYIASLRSKNYKGKFKSNLSGWHSENFDLQDVEPLHFVNNISKILNDCLIDMGWDLEKNKLKITGMWSIINPKNATNSRHIHSNNFISAAYYVQAPENCGDIVFHDPRSANVIRSPIIKTNNKLNSNIFTIMPKEGLLVLFPSYIHHSVNSNESDEERIVISFNINLIY